MTWPNSKCNSWLDPASEVHSGFVLWWLDRFTFLQDINIDAVVEHSTVILQSLKYKTVRGTGCWERIPSAECLQNADFALKNISKSNVWFND